MSTFTIEKAAELVLFLGEDMSAAVLCELAREPYDPDVQMKNFRKTWRYGGTAADILSHVDPLLACAILARFPEPEWAGAVLREMVIFLQTCS
jgi:flagellar motility protein MotE (MotC chaperone)